MNENSSKATLHPMPVDLGGADIVEVAQYGHPGNNVMQAIIQTHEPKERYAFRFMRGEWPANPLDPTPLKAFCREILSGAAEWHDFDGADLQEMAVKHGLLREVTVTEPCGKACMCNEVSGDFPMTCYERTEILL